MRTVKRFFALFLSQKRPLKLANCFLSPNQVATANVPRLNTAKINMNETAGMVSFHETEDRPSVSSPFSFFLQKPEMAC